MHGGKRQEKVMAVAFLVGVGGESGVDPINLLKDTHILFFFSARGGC